MKKHLMTEFLVTYLVIGILGFLIVTGYGSTLIEKYLEKSITKTLHLEADSIAENANILHALEKQDSQAMQHNLESIANYEHAVFWILNTEKKILLSVPDVPKTVLPEAFQPDSWNKKDHQKGTFYGYFSDSRLSVLSPIYSVEETLLGYVVIHYPMTRLYTRRGGVLLISQILFVFLYLLSFTLVALYYFRVHLPLKKIMKGTSEYAAGNLSYRILVNSENEMGNLANTLNYMSETLDQNGEYQREFVSNVSHDFRSPLTSIKGYINAILDGTIPPQNQEKYLRIIASETERLEKLTESLLTLNDLDKQKQNLNKSVFDINQLIHHSAEVFEGICLEKKIRLDFHLTDGELLTLADEQQIQQVLYNLLDNAIKFSPEQSSILLETKRKGNRIFVSVEDHGCGISKDNLPKIWTRFYKTDSSRGRDRNGTGLGLAIVKEILHAHEQQIDVISTEGAGTEFIFTLEKA